MSTINENPLEHQWLLIEQHYASGQQLMAKVIDIHDGSLIVDIKE